MMMSTRCCVPRAPCEYSSLKRYSCPAPAVRGISARPHAAPSCRKSCIAQAIGIFYSTSSGNTETVANIIKEALGPDAAEPADIGDVPDLEVLKKFDGLVVGAPTWNTGADEGRSGTSWDDVLSKIAALNMAGKPVACFGVGDSISYSEYFCDAMEELYTSFNAAGATMVGKWPSKGYGHHESKAEIEPGTFCGLALDQDNEADMTEKRVKAWAVQVLDELRVKV